MICLYRCEHEAAELAQQHPARWRHPNKQLVFDRAASGPAPSGRVELTRWAAAPLPAEITLAPTELVPMPGYYDYAGSDRGVWHVNFADPQLFVAYGSGLLAQDELQCSEHPVLGSLREALLADGVAALTEEREGPTPVLVLGAERRVRLETAPDRVAGRPHGLYGNYFASAPADVVARAVHVLRPPTRTNLIAIAAPVGRGEYTRPQLELVLVAAYTGFAAAARETQRCWPGTPAEVRTGFWGCGAFGGNREVMTLMQILAARLAGVARLRIYAFDDAGRADVLAGAAALDRVLAAGDRRVSDLIERIADLDYLWGTSDGT